MRERDPDPLTLLPAFDRAGDGVYAVDYDEQIVYWNRSAERLLGHRANEVIGLKCFDLIAGGDEMGNLFCQPGCQVIKSARRGKPAETYDVCTRTARGRRVWLNVSIVVLTGARKRSTLTVHLVRDVTKQRASRPRIWQPAAGGDPAVQANPALARLTRRESEVLRHLSAGMSTPEIAEALGVSVVTVRNHIEHLLQKLGVHSKLEAVVLAARHRMV